jgi:PhnB protein
MTKVNVCLSFNGNCESAFTCYKSVFGGEFDCVARYKEMPPSAQYTISDAEKEKIMHIGLPISKETILYGCDTSEAWGTKVVLGNNINICINPDSEAEARRIFEALATGGKITMPLEKQFWGSLNGMVTDKFGVNWMVDYELGAK